MTGDNIATADAANVKVISDISTPAAFAFNGRFVTDDVSKVYLRNGNSKNNQHNFNKGIQSKAADKHFSILNLRKDDVVKIVTGTGTTSFVSTNATVGGVQVVSGDRVGTDVVETEVGATTVCTMTADGNLDLKLGQWAVIMSVTINEPISATLDHTAGAQWGNNTGASTVDASQEHYNGNAGSGWAGCAYAKFSYTIPAGHVITSATLNYTMVQNNSSNQVDYIYYMNKDFDLDWANFAGQTGTDLRNTASRSSSYKTQATVGGGKENSLSVDVTDYVINIAEQGQEYIIFQWTGNGGSGDLYGKGADAAKRPTLVIETAPEAVAPILAAMDDCEAHETSSAFATYIEGLFDAGSLNTADDVYAAHTAWQIAQADAASSNDITKVIFDAAVSDFTRWNNARSNQDQQYTGAPDSKYFDGWDNQPSNAKQKIYGLPAGTYTVKVATRASATLTDKSKYNVWVYGGSADVSVLGNHIGHEGGVLENGWNWTILSFTLAAKADVEIGFYTNPGSGSGLWAGCDDWHLYKGTLSVSGTITSAGWNTFSSPYALDLSTITGGTAYYASAASGSKVTLTPTGDITVPASEGLMIKGTAGETFTIDVAESGTAIDGNLLVGLPNGGKVTANDYNYVFGWADAADPGFYFVNATEPTLGAGKAYLHVDGGVGSRLNIVFGDDEVTGVKEVIEVNDNSFYDLNGRKVAQPQKGLYIVNGKKVVIK